MPRYSPCKVKIIHTHFYIKSISVFQRLAVINPCHKAETVYSVCCLIERDILRYHSPVQSHRCRVSTKIQIYPNRMLTVAVYSCTGSCHSTVCYGIVYRCILFFVIRSRTPAPVLSHIQREYLHAFTGQLYPGSSCLTGRSHGRCEPFVFHRCRRHGRRHFRKFLHCRPEIHYRTAFIMEPVSFQLQVLSVGIHRDISGQSPRHPPVIRHRFKVLGQKVTVSGRITARTVRSRLCARNEITVTIGYRVKRQALMHPLVVHTSGIRRHCRGQGKACRHQKCQHSFFAHNYPPQFAYRLPKFLLIRFCEMNFCRMCTKLCRIHKVHLITCTKLRVHRLNLCAANGNRQQRQIQRIFRKTNIRYYLNAKSFWAKNQSINDQLLT